MYALLESRCSDMGCVFCPDAGTTQPPPDYISWEPGGGSITGLEPFNSPRFFDVLDEMSARLGPSETITVETTVIPLESAALRARIATYPHVTLLVPLYGKNADANERVTRNPAYFEMFERLVASEVGPMLRLQTLPLLATIEHFPEFLDWCAERRLSFGSFRVLTMRASQRERELYRENAPPFDLLVRNYLARIAGQPVATLDACVSALPVCVLQSAGLDERVSPWSEIRTKIAWAPDAMTCPFERCPHFDECPKIPDVYLERYGLRGIAPPETHQRTERRLVRDSRRDSAEDDHGRGPRPPGRSDPNRERHERPHASAGLSAFGPLRSGAELPRGWRIGRISGDDTSVDIGLENAAGDTVHLRVRHPDYPDERGPLDLRGVSISHGDTRLRYDEFVGAAMEIRALLDRSHPEPIDGAAWVRWRSAARTE